MKLKYHFETELDNGRKKGFVILEASPQIRTIFTQKNIGHQRLVLPYLIFVISYTKIKVGDEWNYIYSGITQRGLRIYARNEPLTSKDDLVWLLPTDIEHGGAVCTNHSFDGATHKSLFNLVSFVLDVWFGTSHNILESKFQAWRQVKTIEEISKFDWTFPVPFDRSLYDGHHCYFIENVHMWHRSSFPLSLEKAMSAKLHDNWCQPSQFTNCPEDAIFVDEPWPSPRLNLEEFEESE